MPGDFCNVFTLDRDPGSEAGGVAESPAVDPVCIYFLNRLQWEQEQKN